jgi:hypothetical protein
VVLTEYSHCRPTPVRSCICVNKLKVRSPQEYEIFVFCKNNSCNIWYFVVDYLYKLKKAWMYSLWMIAMYHSQKLWNQIAFKNIYYLVNCIEKRKQSDYSDSFSKGLAYV